MCPTLVVIVITYNWVSTYIVAGKIDHNIVAQKDAR